MSLAGRKGKNTVQAFVIFRNVMGKERSSVNQTNNEIKNARGVRSNAKDMWDKAKEENCMQKKWKSRELIPNGGTGDARVGWAKYMGRQLRREFS